IGVNDLTTFCAFHLNRYNGQSAFLYITGPSMSISFDRHLHAVQCCLFGFLCFFCLDVQGTWMLLLTDGALETFRTVLADVSSLCQASKADSILHHKFYFLSMWL